MHIYQWKLSYGTSYINAVAGNFSGIRNNGEVIVSRNQVLELHVVDTQGKIFILCSEYFHFSIRSLAVLNRRDRDFLVIASGSGNVFLLYYSPENNEFLPIIKSKYGMPATLPEIPGYFIATSFGGFALGSMSENYIFYNLATEGLQNNNSVLSITQPKCDICDFIGIQNSTPTFAALEVSREDGIHDPEKFIQYLRIYQVDFKSKHVDILSYPLPHHGNKLIYVPEGENHPDGLIVCFIDMLIFKSLKGHKEIKRYLPQRKNDAFKSKGFILTSSTLYEIEGNVVVLAQSEQGDLFSIKLDSSV